MATSKLWTVLQELFTMTAQFLWLSADRIHCFACRIKVYFFLYELLCTYWYLVPPTILISSISAFWNPSENPHIEHFIWFSYIISLHLQILSSQCSSSSLNHLWKCQIFLWDQLVAELYCEMTATAAQLTIMNDITLAFIYSSAEEGSIQLLCYYWLEHHSSISPQD